MKHNTDEGYVELHLHEPRSKGRNPSIKRVMSAAHNNSTYFINGKVAREKEVSRE